MMAATTASNSEQLNRSSTDCALSVYPETSAELRLYLCVVVCVCSTVGVCSIVCVLCSDATVSVLWCCSYP